jgi:hypothetical protein
MANPFTPQDDEAPQPADRRRFQFGMWVWFPAVFLVSVVAMALGGMLSSEVAGDPASGIWYVLLLSATPIGLIFLMGVFRGMARWVSRRR